MNLLVGATGFIGGHLVEYLFQQNEISKGVFRKGAHLKIMDLNGVQGIEADLLDHHSLHEAMEGVDTVYSMASPMPGVDGGFLKVNREGLSNLLEVAREAKVKTLVHLGTLDVYGKSNEDVTARSEPNPRDDYQRSKLAADRFLLEWAGRSELPKVTVIRAARAVGSRDASLVVPLLKMIEAGSVTLPPSGKMSFTHPKDIAAAMYQAATKPTAGQHLCLIKSFDATPEELAIGVSASAGKEVRVRKEGMFASSSLPPYTRDQLRSHLLLNDQSGWSGLGYAPKYDLHATCDEIGLWYKKNPWTTEQD